jgi:hypothetical protein
MGTGGMRFGAGRPGYRAKAEELHRLDIREWHRGGYLSEGRAFSWSWTCGGSPAGSIGVRVHDRKSLTLQYVTGPADARRDGTQTIWLTHTPCPYGGARPWFTCPICTRRAGLLFLRWGRFACRHCQQVAYATQSCDRLDALWRKQAKIERRLGKYWRRPKGMRQATYSRLMETLFACEEAREALFADVAARLLMAAHRR